MATTNPITNDEIKSKALSKQGRENYDFIFRKKKQMKLASASWCGPCSVLKSKIAKEGLNVEIEDADDNPDFFKKFNIRSVPKLVIFNEDSFEVISESENILKYIREHQ